MPGVLTLIPTPIAENLPLEAKAHEVLTEAVKSEDVIAVEELKEARRRWVQWKLPRSALQTFVEYNEHTETKVAHELLAELKKGKNVFLMSDGGLPAFCDPGLRLVDLCHENEIKVSATPFPHAISLAIALSGIDCSQFCFLGFAPQKTEDRKKFFTSLSFIREPSVVMDTPYHFKKMLEDLGGLKNRLFIATNLSSEDEFCSRGSIHKIKVEVEKKKFNPPALKREFVLVIEPLK